MSGRKNTLFNSDDEYSDSAEDDRSRRNSSSSTKKAGGGNSASTPSETPSKKPRKGGRVSNLKSRLQRCLTKASEKLNEDGFDANDRDNIASVKEGIIQYLALSGEDYYKALKDLDALRPAPADTAKFSRIKQTLAPTALVQDGVTATQLRNSLETVTKIIEEKLKEIEVLREQQFYYNHLLDSKVNGTESWNFVRNTILDDWKREDNDFSKA